MSSDEDNDEEVLDGEASGELGILSRQERDRAGTVFHHCATAVRKILRFVHCIKSTELTEFDFPGDRMHLLPYILSLHFFRTVSSNC